MESGTGGGDVHQKLKRASRLSNKLQEKVHFEHEVSKELARRNEQLSNENQEEIERYRTLAAAFEELFYEFKDLLDNHETLLNGDIPIQGSVRHNELLAECDEKTSFIRSIRSRAGIDKGRNRGSSRQSETGFSLMSGSLLLRKSSTETTMRGGGESNLDFSTSTAPSEDGGSSNSRSIAGKLMRGLSTPVTVDPDATSHNSTPSAPPKRRLSLNPFTSNPKQQTSLAAAAADVMVLEASSSPSVLPTESLPPDSPTLSTCQTSCVNVPLFEHFLVIGVPVETALDVSNQLRQKQAKVSERIMTRIGTFFSSRNNSATISNSGTELTSRATLSGPASSSSMFSMVMSSDSQGGTSNPEKGRSRWGTGFLSRMTSRESDFSYHESKHMEGSVTEPSCDSVSGGGKLPSVVLDSDSTRGGCAPPVGSGSKNEHCTYTSPEILYRYPPDADPPPPEVCDFCMPSGGKLRHLQPADSETSIMEILYGQGQSQRSSRCFIFILEDKTMDLSKVNPNDEAGVDTGRTYGICVVHPRLLNPSIVDKDHRHISAASGDVNPDGTPRQNIEFEASVCYCFITRFPLFDFFFKVIFNIITYERIVRMERITENTDLIDRTAYEYIPEEVYNKVLQKLTTVEPPRYNKAIEFSISPAVSTVSYIRSAPSGGNPEHVVNAAEWALPPLVHWLSPKIIAWALGLLMCEVKLVIIGADPAIVSCAVIGLTSLLKPLQWVSPMIPIMPLKNIDFLEAPVPIIAGMVVDGDSVAPQCLNSDAITPLSILRLCEDGESVTAVLDLSVKDVYVLRSHSEVLPEMMFPGAEELIESVQNILTKQQPSRSCSSFDDESLGTVRRDNKPNFTVNSEHMQMSRAVQECVGKHIRGLADEAKTVAAEVLRDQMMAVEMRVKASLQRIDNRMRTGSNPTPPALESIASTVLESVEEEHHDALHAESADSESLSATEAQNSISSSMSPLRRVSSSSVRSVDGVDNCPVTRNESAVSMLSADSHGSTVIGGGLEIPIVSLKNYHIDTSGEDQSLFLRRFVSTQMYSAYDQEIMGIMHDMEDVVGHDQDDLISRTQSASRTSVGSHSGPAIISQSNGGKKARSRSLYLTPADHAHCSHDIHSRKRCSSSATSSFSLVTRERRSSSGDNGDALNKS